MGMWEEASDPVMGKKDKNEERKERILNLTLEIIYLLTGEGYVIPKKKSPTVGLGALHAPGSVIQKENDKKILELISNIIQLLTGEVAIRCEDVSIYFSLEEWEYIKENKALYREGIEEEEPQQLRPLDCEYEDKSIVTGNLEATLWPNNDPAKILAEDLVNYEHKNLSKPDISPVEQPPPANGIKGEPVSCEEGIESDCGINPLTEEPQRTDSPYSLADNYISNGIKEEAASCESVNQSDCRNNPLTEEVQLRNTPTPIMGCSLNNGSAEDYITVAIKEEPASWEEETQSDCSINSPGEQTQDTDTPTSIMRFCLNSSLLDTNLLNAIKEDTLSCEGDNYSDCSINPLAEQSPPGCKPFTCSECGKSYTRRYNLKVHLKSHTEGKTFSCSECGEGFADHTDLVTHRRLHITQKPFPCKECGKCFTNCTNLRAHNKTHTGEKPYSCTECGKTFRDRSHLNIHKKRHTGEKPYTCSECGKCFAYRSNLMVHVRIHTGEKPFTCSKCGKCFTDHANLIVHERMHRGEKSFFCSECGKCFAQSTKLTLHQRIHTKVKPFKCNECGKCFTQSPHLIVHQRIHTGERPYCCADCGRCFISSSRLNTHRKVHKQAEGNTGDGKTVNS
uniref:C2H2-type domain-containing protein n=1 Tax=Xenopus tropicalis TaxID=8364 RepID=A0A803J2D3_XENTR